MKIKPFFLLICLSLLNACGCDNSLDYVIEGYQSSNEHFEEEAYRDHTDYCEYKYNQEDSILFRDSYAYHPVTNQDISTLKGFIQNFDDAVQWRKGYQQWYHFNQKKLSIDDYFYLRIIDPNEVYGEYHCYDIYYYDVSECTLYYMSSYS